MHANAHTGSLTLSFRGEAGSCASKPDASGKESGGHQPDRQKPEGTLNLFRELKERLLIHAVSILVWL
ncbi:MAG: hypothetical protein ACLR8P_13420 [Clostridium fessum]